LEALRLERTKRLAEWEELAMTLEEQTIA
jgi:hypothetical protein